MADYLKEELRLIGCHANGDARCTCNIGQDAAARIERLEAALLAADELAEMVRRSATHQKDGQPYYPNNPRLYAALTTYRARRATGGGT